MQRHPKVEVLEMSDLYPNKGTDKYYCSEQYEQEQLRTYYIERDDR